MIIRSSLSSFPNCFYACQRVAMQWLFTVIGHVLGFAETPAAADKTEVKNLVAVQRKELRRITAYYEHAAQKSGQTVYLAGALLGILPPIVLLAVALLLDLAWSSSESVRIGFACFAAGAVGAAPRSFRPCIPARGAAP